MLTESLHASPWLPAWLSGGRKSTADPISMDEEIIELLQLCGAAARKQATLAWGKTNLRILLRHYEVGYEADSRLGLRGLTEETGQ